MPEADRLEAPQGGTFYGSLLEAISEAAVGNGIQNDGDARTVAGPGMEVTTSPATGLRYGGSSIDLSASTFVLSDGPTSTTNGVDDRRVDLVYYDDAADEYAVLEGVADPNPEPPDTPGDGLLLALITVRHGVTDIDDTDILNWRVHAGVDFPVAAEDMADASVTESAIADGAVTGTKIADGAVSNSKLGDDVQTTITIEDDGVVIRSDVDTINFGDGLDVTDDGDGRVRIDVDPSVLGADESLAQALSRRANDPAATRIEDASGVSARKAQVLSRRQ